WTIRCATRLIANSEYSRGEVVRNVGVPGDRVDVVYHGVPDPFGALPPTEREPIALTVSNVAWLSFERKGLRPFVQAARLAPEVRFVLVGQSADTSGALLRELGGSNAELTARVSDAELATWYRPAPVVLQPS